MTDRLDEIRARLDAATPGPWEVVCDTTSDVVGVIDGDYDCADFIAHAPADIAWLLAEVERLASQEKSLKEIQARLQGRYQVAASKEPRKYKMDARMVNDGRKF